MICGISLAFHMAQESKDPRTKVGACILDNKGRVMGVGYNGFPRGVEDHDHILQDRKIKNLLMVHAEANAILNSRHGCEGGHLYCTKFPCHTCAGLVIQAGIKSVTCPIPCDDPVWVDSQNASMSMLLQAGVDVYMEENR